MNLTVWEWAHEPEWSDLFSTPSHTHEADWFGAPSKRGPLSSSVSVSRSRVWWAFWCDGRVSTIETAVPGEPFEGLWQFDVAELFVADAVGGRYLEWNLGPQGAWWGCTFESYRVRRSVVDGRELDVKTYAERNTRGWRGAMSYRRGPDGSLFGAPQHIQCCAIMDSPLQTFFSSRPISKSGSIAPLNDSESRIPSYSREQKSAFRVQREGEQVTDF
jgi:hypothetical protein